jgi:hypothetical protein
MEEPMRTRKTKKKLVPLEPAILMVVTIAALASLSLCAGCAEARDVGGDDGADAGVAAEAPVPLAFALDGTAEVTARWWVGDGWDAVEETIDVRAARAALRTSADGAVTIDALRVRLGGVALGDATDPDALRVADVELALAGPVELGVAVWDGAGRMGAAEGTVALALAWSLAAGDEQLPLAPQTIDAVALRLGLRRDGDAWSAAITLERDGRAWAWADLFELSDLWIGLSGIGEHED